MAKTHQRVIALIAAVVFLVSVVGLSVAVVWQIREESKKNKQLSDIQNQLQNPEQTNQPKEGALQGTKLKDFTPVDSVDALQKVDLVEGTGEEVKPGATVTAHYTGALAKDGVIFQSSHDTGQPIPFSLDGVIKGWTDGVPGMKVGGKRRLLIPYAMAYGEQGRPDGGIPAKADLVFDIELVAVQQ